jgi:hypothetical protein
MQRRLGIAVPDDYKEFLINCNGGYANDNECILTFFHPIYREKTSIGMHKFFSADSTMSEPLDPNVPSGILVVADDAGGCLIVLSCRDSDFGSVYWCDLDHYDGDDKFTVKIASSFSEFYKSLLPAQ